MMLGNLQSRNIFVQHQCVRESLVRTDPAGSAMRWFNTITRRVYSVEDLILSGTLMDCIVSSVRGSSYMEVLMGFPDS